MKMPLSIVIIVLINVLNVAVILKIVIHVLVTELNYQAVSALMEPMTQLKLPVQTVLNNVVLVIILPLIVQVVLLSTVLFQNVLSSHHPLKVLESKTFQSDLPEFLIVTTDVELVQILLKIVLLVILTDKTHLPVDVFLHIMKTPLKLVLLAQIIVLNVPVKSFVFLAEETESTSQIVSALLDYGIVVKKTVSLVDIDVLPVLDLNITVIPVSELDLQFLNVHVQVVIMKILMI
jgi:hypothetical protein